MEKSGQNSEVNIYTARELLLASIIVHLAEHIETGESVDYVSAETVSARPAVRKLFKDLQAVALLPETRKPVPFIDNMIG